MPNGEPERKEQAKGTSTQQGEEQPQHDGGAPQDLGTNREKILEEQQLSGERQMHGKGWSELPPGRSRGTTPVPPSPASPSGEAREKDASPTPGAHRAEQEGQRTRRA